MAYALYGATKIA